MFEIITNRFKKRPKVAGLVYGLENGDCLANGEISPDVQKKIAERKAKLVKVFEQMLQK